MRIDRAKLASALANSGLKVYELAELSSLSRGTVTAIKNGKSCSEETAWKLANGLGVSLDQILETARDTEQAY